MKGSENNLSFYSSVIIQMIFAILLIIIYAYLYKLENIGCECAEHPNKDFIKNFTLVALSYFLVTSFVSVSSIAKNMGPAVVQLLAMGTFIFFLIFVVYIYYAFDYVRFLTNEKCKCSEDMSRDVIAVGTMVSLFLFLTLLFTIIIVPILISTLSTLLGKIELFEEEVENTVRDPMQTIRKTPGLISKSVNDIGSFVNKSAQKISNVRSKSKR
jgi:predicted PurR-regulated permease PerM